MSIPCPYGEPGDTLWVRETHAIVHEPVWYDSDDAPRAVGAVYRADWEGEAPLWSPSIHMPRWASRITLEVLDVRVERLDEVTEAEAQLEGFDSLADFQAIWAILHRDAGDNPWLWRVEFRRVK